MPVDRAVELHPITPADVGAVAEFLHQNLNARVSVSAWAAAVVPPWKVDSPNHGYLLRHEGDIVGVHLAFYSRREIEGRLEDFCNLGAWCVLDPYRAHSVRLLRALLAQRGYHFTDLSPSGNVVPLNARLRFRHLDTATALVPNLSVVLPGRGIELLTERKRIEERLTGRDLETYTDQVDTAGGHHVVLVRGDETCHVVYRRDRRKRLPLFVSILHVSNRELFRVGFPLVRRHALLEHGALATLAELRVVGARPRPSVMLRKPRPRMFKSPTLGADSIDYLYSELVCVAW